MESVPTYKPVSLYVSTILEKWYPYIFLFFFLFIFILLIHSIPENHCRYMELMSSY